MRLVDPAGSSPAAGSDEAAADDAGDDAEDESGDQPSSPPAASSPPDALTTRARMRDTAIEVFAREGFTATVRTIASAAGVSPGLVIHHFGSKERLRAECDAHVLRLTRESSADKVAPRTGLTPFATLTARMDDVEADGPWVLYLLRSIQSGGTLARDLYEHLASDTEATLAVGVAAGTVVPSSDEPARARYLVAQTLGALLVDLAVNPPADPGDAGAILRGFMARMAVPATEVAVHGVLRDDALLTAVIDHQEEQDGNQHR